jgi:uncharacterized membrane protein/uncharacterized protein YjeT (DUF2065 family)
MVTTTAPQQQRAQFRYEGSTGSSHHNGHHPNGATGGETERLARALGIFSLGLGLAQMLAPQEVAQLAGIHDASDNVMRLVGLREIVSGVGLLTQENPTAWLWLRVGGDVMDLALLNSVSSSPYVDRERLSAATAAVAGIAAADAFAGTRLISGQGKFPANTVQAGATPVGDGQIKAAVTVNAPIAEVYTFWEGLGNLPRFMAGVATVEALGAGKLHWKMEGPAGLTVEFDSEITEAVPNERIAWRTIEGTGVEASGAIRFRTAPGGRGTQVIYDARFTPPGGPLGEKIAGLFGPALSMKMQGDLLRSKQLLELGEIVQSDDSVKPGPNPAQPVPAELAA